MNRLNLSLLRSFHLMSNGTLCIRSLLLILFTSAVMLAQTGAITGVVRDNTGAVIPGAQVTITDTGTAAINVGTGTGGSGRDLRLVE